MKTEEYHDAPGFAIGEQQIEVSQWDAYEKRGFPKGLFPVRNILKGVENRQGYGIRFPFDRPHHASWCNGSTSASGAFCHGSNPCEAARHKSAPGFAKFQIKRNLNASRNRVAIEK